MADGGTTDGDDVPMTVADLRAFLEKAVLPDDALVMMEQHDPDDPGSVDEVLVTRVTGAVGYGEASKLVFRLD